MPPKSKSKKKANSDIKIKTSSDFIRAIQFKKPKKGLVKTKMLLEAQKNKGLLTAVRAYVFENYGKITWSGYKDPRTGKTINFSRRVIKSMLDNADTEIEEEEADLEQQITDEANFAATAIITGTGEQCGDGNCYILTVNIGLGDCTVISSPKGIRLMIDMGSDSLQDAILPGTPIYNPSTGKDEPYSDPETQKFYTDTAQAKVMEAINSALFLNGKKQIHFLVLTHSDADHHNKITWLGSDISFGRAYYSGDSIAAYFPSSTFISTACRNTPTNIKQVNLKQASNGTITKNIDGNVLPSVAPGTGMFDNEYIDPATGAIVIYHEADTGFKISILSGNVEGVVLNGTWYTNDADVKQAPQDSGLKLNATDANKKSLVVLVEYNGKKAIITGDATAVTENFIVNQYASKGILSGLTMFRIGHHGSLTSSCYRFVKTLGTVDSIVASTSGKFTVLHGLPKGQIMGLFSENSAAAAHSIYAFSTTGSMYTKDTYFKNITNNLFATGSNGTSKFVF